jgi:hypothetical protein
MLVRLATVDSLTGLGLNSSKERAPGGNRGPGREGALRSASVSHCTRHTNKETLCVVARYYPLDALR